MRQAGVVAAGPSQELGAQAVVCPSSLGYGGQRGVAHRPQAGVLTVQRQHTQDVSSSVPIEVLL